MSAFAGTRHTSRRRLPKDYVVAASMRRAALLSPSVRATLQQAGGDSQLAERLLSSSFAGTGPSQTFNAASSFYNALRQDISAVRCFARAYSVLAGRAAAGSGMGLSHLARNAAGPAASRSFRQVRFCLCLQCRPMLSLPPSPCRAVCQQSIM